MKTKLAVAIVAISCTTASACAQSLYELGTPEAPGRGGGGSGGGAAVVQPTLDGRPSLLQVSLTAVEPPPPRAFEANDFITIIISERAQVTRTQELETAKEYELSGAIKKFIDLTKLLEFRLDDGRMTGNNVELDLEYESEFGGDGEYTRDDRVTARITARVLEVKPNGTLLIAARSTVTTDKEEQIITLAGYCRSDDITDANTVQSNQLFDLRLDIQNSGDIKNAAKKGLVPRALETLFNF